MTRKSLGLVASGGLVTLLYGASPASAQTLGAAQSFGVLGGSSVTAGSGGATINGDVGVSPGTSITGTITVVPPFGTHNNDAAAIAARAATLTLYNALASMGGATVILPGLNGQSRGPGIYSSGDVTLTNGTPLTLTGAGQYIFQVNSITTDVGSSVNLVGVDPCMVFWQVATIAALNGTTFPGNIVTGPAAGTGVHLDTAGASLVGRALASAAGDVTMAGGNNTVGGCSAASPPPPPPPLPPTIAKVFGPASIPVGGVSRLTIVLSNPNAAAISLTAAFTDTLPSGVLVAAPPDPTTTCGGAVTAPIGGSTVTLPAGSTIPSGSCNIQVNVTAAAAGTFVNTIPAGGLQTSSGNNAAPASATVTTNAAIPPTPGQNVCVATAPDLFIVKRHTDPFVTGTNATYSIAMGNNGVTSIGAITVTDTLPATVAFVSATGVGWTCAAAGQVVTCTTTASIPGIITLIVRPGVDAVPAVTNNAVVSGGGDCDVTNNATSDVAVVTLGVPGPGPVPGPVPVPGPGPVPGPVPVPTLSEWAFIMLAVLLAVAGVVALRRRTGA